MAKGKTTPIDHATPAVNSASPPIVLVAILLAAGVAGWLALNNFVLKRLPWDISIPLILGVAAASLVLLPRVRESVSRALDRLRDPDPKTRASIAVGVAVISGLYLAFTAYVHARDLFPRIHDEHSYLVGAHMLARGRLWMPQHPLADFFESFHILVKPVYASIYFPGTALLHVPSVWLGFPPWVMPVVIAAIVVGLTYRVVTELLDGVAGLLASMILVGNGSFRVFSTVVMAQIPAAMLGLVMIWAWLRWRRERRVIWAVVLGTAAGWAAITRPVDALVYALPIGAAIAWALRRQPIRAWFKPSAAVVASATPFLLLQIVFNLGVAGAPLRTPYVAYLDQHQPGSAFGSGVSAATAPSTRPSSALPQKQIYFEQLFDSERGLRATGPVHWFAERLAMTIWLTLPSATLFIVVPAIVLTRFRVGWIGVMLIIPVLFIAMYSLNPFYLGHYSLTLAPCVACWAVVGAAALTGSRRGPGPALTVAIAAICLGALPEINWSLGDGSQSMLVMSTAEKKLAEIDDAPAVVLFRFHPGSSVHEEPVYNSSVAWPDDAKIVRAHDLGPARNAEIFDYYGGGRHGPPRTFYLFDRGNGQFIRLGSRDQAPARLAQYDAK